MRSRSTFTGGSIHTGVMLQGSLNSQRRRNRALFGGASVPNPITLAPAAHPWKSLSLAAILLLTDSVLIRDRDHSDERVLARKRMILLWRSTLESSLLTELVGLGHPCGQCLRVWGKRDKSNKTRLALSPPTCVGFRAVLLGITFRREVFVSMWSLHYFHSLHISTCI
jgi:hypothetical protein